MLIFLLYLIISKIKSHFLYRKWLCLYQLCIYIRAIIDRQTTSINYNQALLIFSRRALHVLSHHKRYYPNHNR